MGIDLVFIFGILDSPKEKLAILFAEVVEAGDPITELVDDVDGGGEERVELGDAGSLPGNHPRLAVQLLLGQVRVLQQHDFNPLPKKTRTQGKYWVKSLNRQLACVLILGLRPRKNVEPSVILQ